MQRTTKQWLMVLAIISIAFAYFMFFSNNEEVQTPQLDTSPSNENQLQFSEAETKHKTETVSSRQLEEQCDNSQLHSIKEFAYPKWLSFRKDIYKQGIVYPDLQLALKNANAIVVHPSLLQKTKQKSRTTFSLFYSKLPQETQTKINGTLLSEGISGIASLVNKGELPSEIFSESSRYLFKIMVNMSSDTLNSNSFPNEEELLLLTSNGLVITIEDYNKATKINAPIEYLELLIKYGPDPESLNFQHEYIPVDIAAEKNNLELLEFWLNKGFTTNNNMHNGDYSDILLLNVFNTERFREAWLFLKSRGKTLIQADTARTLLNLRNFDIEENIRQQLVILATKKPSLATIEVANNTIYQTAITNITSINQSILKLFPRYKNCQKNINDALLPHVNSYKWVFSQLMKGKTIEDILEILSQQSPALVDTFRRKLNRGHYKPQLKPFPGQEFKLIIDEDIQKFVGLILLKNWEETKSELNEGSLNDQLLMTLITTKSGLQLPPDIVDTIIKKISTIPLGGYNTVTKELSIEKLERMELNSVALNKLDESGKNLFYYATKNNNIELMNWLLDKNVDMDPDKYGSDPLDAALRWNTHPETLQTLCNLDFPIKDKHMKRFEEIQKDDPNEAIEILERCPGFGE